GRRRVVRLRGKRGVWWGGVRAGARARVAKQKDPLKNGTRGKRRGGVPFAAVTFPEPVLSYAIEPKSRGDEDKISGSMHRLEEEDPSIKSSRDPQKKELLLSGQGQPQTEATVPKLQPRFAADVKLETTRIPDRGATNGRT